MAMSNDTDAILEEELKNRLSLPSSDDDRLYGRTTEESVLNNSYYATLTVNRTKPAHLLLIRGDSGLGKTKLAEQLKTFVAHDDGFFIRGKFDQSSYRAADLPYAAIINAFGEYCSQLEQREDDRYEVVEALRKEFQNNEASLLCEALPSLRGLLLDDSCSDSGDGDSNQLYCSESTTDDPTSSKILFNKLNYMLKRFIRTICIGDPIIFLMDDMQWSDSSSLDLIKTMASSARSPFLFVFTYRPVSCDHPFLKMVEHLETQNYVNEVTLNGLNGNEIHEMVSNILGGQNMLGGKCLPLSNYLHGITNGNPLQVRHLIDHLLKNNLIGFDEGHLVYDIEKIKENNTTSDSLVTMACHKIEACDESTKTLLQMCACIGFTIALELILFLLTQERNSEETREYSQDEHVFVGKHPIATAISQGLLTRSHNGTCLSFTHDSVQSAAYSILSPEDQVSFHLKLGRILKSKLHDNELSPSEFLYIFQAANQLARGCDVVEECERIEVILILLHVADESKRTAAFQEALYFYAKAIHLIQNADWINDYRCCCDAYLNASESAVWAGTPQDAMPWIEVLTWRTRGRMMDQLRTSWIKFNLMISSGDRGAIEVSIKDLTTLRGVKIKLNHRKSRTLYGMIRTKSIMRGVSETTLLKHPRIDDEKAETILCYLNQITLVGFGEKHSLVPQLCFKILELNLKCGMSSTMPVAIAWYGALHIRFGFSLSKAVKYGQMAIRLQEAMNCTETLAQVNAICYGFIFSYAHKFSTYNDELLKGHASGLQSGDIRHAMACAHFICVSSFHSGENLEDVRATLETYSREMAEFHVPILLGINKNYQHVVAVLTGSLNSSNGRNGLIDIDNFLAARITFDKDHCALSGLLVTYMIGDYQIAWNTSTKCPKDGHLPFYVCSFFRGMTALALVQAKLHKKRDLKKVIQACRNAVNNGYKRSPINYGHYKHLLDAEYSTFQRKLNLAEKFFSLAIEFASKAGVVHIQALANERLGHYQLSQGKRDLSYKQLRKAHDLYSAWGARLKCELLLKKFKNLLG